MQDFNASVDAAIEWVETNSNWEETLLIVTADHETGYLSGMNEPEDGKWNVMAGDSSTLPTHEWYSGNHTNQVVPFFFKGAGSEDIMGQVKGTDPVRGDYIDNTDIAKLAKNAWWTDGSNTGGNDDDDKKPVASGSSNAFSGLAGAGIMAAVIGALVALAQSVGVVSIDTSAIDRLIRQFK